MSNILIVTQRINDDGSYFGFFHQWIKAFANTFDKVTVISLEVRSYDLPSNVEVLSLGKEDGRSICKYIYRLFKYSWLKRNDYDFVFAHMSPWYVICGFPIWKILGKPIGLWYVHRHVDLKLRVAHILTDVVFTAAPLSFGINSKKVHYMGQSVDLDQFTVRQKLEKKEIFEIIVVGRVTPIKRLHVLVAALKVLKDKGLIFYVTIVGDAVTKSDIVYKEQIKIQIESLGLNEKISMCGFVKNLNMPDMYNASHLAVNLCPTGGLDKTVLEAMACGLPVVVANQAFEPYFGEYNDYCLFREDDYADCAQKIIGIMEMPDSLRANITSHLLQVVKEKSDLRKLIQNIDTTFKGLC